MHVQFFPVYVLTCGAHNSEPLLSFDLRIDSYESPDSVLTGFDLYDGFRAAGVSRQPDLQSFFRDLKFHMSTSGTWFVGFFGSNSLVL